MCGHLASVHDFYGDCTEALCGDPSPCEDTGFMTVLAFALERDIRKCKWPWCDCRFGPPEECG